MESEYKMPPSLEAALRELSRELGLLTGEVRSNTAHVAKILEKHEKRDEELEQRDDEIEAKADEANEEIKAAKNKFAGWMIGSATGGSGLMWMLTKVFP